MQIFSCRLKVLVAKVKAQVATSCPNLGLRIPQECLIGRKYGTPKASPALGSSRSRIAAQLKTINENNK